MSDGEYPPGGCGTHGAGPPARFLGLIAVPGKAGTGRSPLPTIVKGTAMSIISVDTELLQLKSANVKATVDRISADVQAMKHGLDELQGPGAAPPPPIPGPGSPSGR